MSGQSGKLVAGVVVLHLLCCGLPLLFAAGAFAGSGALLGSGMLVAVGVAGLATAAVVAVGRARRGSDPQCCAPEPATGFVESGRR
jgi:hypothetical protein